MIGAFGLRKTLKKRQGIHDNITGLNIMSTLTLGIPILLQIINVTCFVGLWVNITIFQPLLEIIQYLELNWYGY